MREARPRIAPHARVHRRDVRGEPWAVLHNGLNGEQVRVNGAALAIVDALDGHRTVEEAVAATRTDADLATREALADCLVTLESSGLLSFGRSSDTGRLLARAGRRRRAVDPLALRLPLLDPDRALERLRPLGRAFAGRPVAVLLATLFALALATGVAAAGAIAEELARVAATPSAWWLYAVLYPLLKLVHELAHAMCVKHHGGAVHEAGLTLLVLMPVPYVDASDSARFERRGRRVAVAAAGMLAEGALAALGLLLWSVTEAGLVHDVAFATALLGSVSTLLFNANPLLRFDGYQILQDVLDMPNLGTRSSAYLGWLFRRHALGARVPPAPVTGPRERGWLLGYGTASLVYRWVLTLGIALWLASAMPVLGIPLALFALYRLAGRPLVRGVRYLHGTPELSGRRPVALATLGGGALALVAALALVPLPSSTRVEGVVRASGQAALYATVGGRVAEAPLAPGAAVRAGERVLRLAAPELVARRAVLDAEIGVLVARRNAALAGDPASAAALATDLAVRRAERATLARDIAELDVLADRDGRFAPHGGRLDVGRRVARGEMLGHVVGRGGLHVEAIVEQRAIGRVRDGVRHARVRLAERTHEVLPARLVAAAPAGDRRLPSAALAWDGRRGTPVASEGEELRTLEPVFHVELSLPEDARARGIGGRAYVTLVHAPEPLGRRWWRATRQLLLETLSI